jgi:hypothetical protein
VTAQQGSKRLTPPGTTRPFVSKGEIVMSFLKILGQSVAQGFAVKSDCSGKNVGVRRARLRRVPHADPPWRSEELMHR